jgi:hypothetical protein
MNTSANKKIAQAEAIPSCRAIQLSILAELRMHTVLLTTLCQHQDDAVARDDRRNGPFVPRRTAKPIPPPPSGPVPEYDPITGSLSFPPKQEGIEAEKSPAGSGPLEFA